MSGGEEGLRAHLAQGITTICRCWRIERRDGTVHGFTDHDGVVSFGGTDFEPHSGMTASAFAQTSGLAVDNTEVVGALSSLSVREADIAAGRFDGAEVRAWKVNWRKPGERAETFRGTIGEISRGETAFTAEVRGLAEPLGRQTGRVYHPRCSAVLGDAACRFDVDLPGYSLRVPLIVQVDETTFEVARSGSFAEGWFVRGVLRVETGQGAGLCGIVKRDVFVEARRRIELWQGLRLPLASGVQLRLEPGCDKRAATCRVKFDNFLNFQGFPHIPGEDWLSSVPGQGEVMDGGSLFR